MQVWLSLKKQKNQEPGYILLFINADLVCLTAKLQV